MKLTPIYKFRKPEGPDTYNVNDFNANWDLNETILEELKVTVLNEAVTPDKVIQAIDAAVAAGRVVNVNRLDQKKSSDFATAAQGRLADAALPRAGGTMSGALDMAFKGIKNVPQPTEQSDAASKAYVDGIVNSVAGSVLSEDSSSFSCWQWLENHWADVKEGPTVYKVNHNSDGSVSVFIVAKKNASNGAAIALNNKSGGRAIQIINGRWDYAPWVRAHVDHLDSDDAEATLSAKQGRTLRQQVATALSNITNLGNVVGSLSELRTTVKSKITLAINSLHDRLATAEGNIGTHDEQIAALDLELKKKVAKWQAANALVIDGHVMISVTVNSTDARPNTDYDYFDVIFDIPQKPNYTIKGFSYEGLRTTTRSQSASFEIQPGNAQCKMTITDRGNISNWLSGSATSAVVYVNAIYSYNKPAI